jgi:hypothetical protein
VLKWSELYVCVYVCACMCVYENPVRARSDGEAGLAQKSLLLFLLSHRTDTGLSPLREASVCTYFFCQFVSFRTSTLQARETQMQRFPPGPAAPQRDWVFFLGIFF